MLAILVLWSSLVGPHVLALAEGGLGEPMRLTVDHLLASQTSEGLFPYGFDFQANQPLEADRMSPSNLIRQAGTASALAHYARFSKDPRLVEPLQRAILSFSQRSLPIGKSRLQYWVEQTRVMSLPFGRWKLRALLDRLGLLYEPAGNGKLVSPNGRYKGALAGTVALSLLTELYYADTAGDNRFADLRAAWLEGLLSLQIPGGGFREDPTKIDESDYFNGEGWLALSVYVDRHSDDARASAALADIDRVFMARYSQYYSPGFYHWGVMAAAQRYKTTSDPRFIAFLKNQTAREFDRLHEASTDAPSFQGNLCVDMEGLAATLAAMNLSPERGSFLANSLRDWLRKEASRLPRLQIRPGRIDMTLDDGTVLHAPKMAQFVGAFLWAEDRPSIRVDAAQHCLSAMTMIEENRLLDKTR